MRKYKFKIRGNSYEVEILKVEGNTTKIEVNGTQYAVELEREEAVSKTPTLVRSHVSVKPKETPKTSNKNNKVKAPLPGNIIKVMVKEGDEVKIGENLMIMEAMKMENNILAEMGGKVAKVNVKEGDTVLQDDTLVEIN